MTWYGRQGTWDVYVCHVGECSSALCSEAFIFCSEISLSLCVLNSQNHWYSSETCWS